MNSLIVNYFVNNPSEKTIETIDSEYHSSVIRENNFTKYITNTLIRIKEIKNFSLISKFRKKTICDSEKLVTIRRNMRMKYWN